MHQFLSIILANLTQTLYKQTILILTILFCIGVGIALSSMSSLSMNLIESQALQHAALSAEALNKSRTLYSANAVNRAKGIEGITVTHEYHNLKGAIPNPATYTIELGKQLSSNDSGNLIRLYSDYPFPHRKAEGGPKDDFELEALTYLRKHPTQAFYRQEKFQDNLSFRYAEAVIMEPSCVACHNTHRDSPRKDWKVGDVRGVLEITQPLGKFIVQTRTGLRGIFLTLGGISILGLSGLTLVIGRLRQTTKELERKVKERTKELERLSIVDGLTQIANRRCFDEFLNTEWRRMARNRQPLSLIFCDVDYFKRYNDRYGHQAGDDCLVQVAQAISSSIKRPADLAARYGGEEFAVILPNTHLEGTIKVAEDIRYAVQKLQIAHEASEVNEYVTLSLGVSSIVPTQELSSEDLIANADKALYEAKDKGRNCVVANPSQAISH